MNKGQGNYNALRETFHIPRSPGDRGLLAIAAAAAVVAVIGLYLTWGRP